MVGDWSSALMAAGTINIPEPIMLPMISMIQSVNDSFLFKTCIFKEGI
jgi:hypothetical protein